MPCARRGDKREGNIGDVVSIVGTRKSARGTETMAALAKCPKSNGYKSQKVDQGKYCTNYTM